MGLDADTALRPAGEDSWEGEIVVGWQTPRGPLGGYVMAILMRGLALAVDDTERVPRSVTMHFLRVPEEGPVSVTAQVEREGRSLSTVSGRLEQDGKLIGLALGAYSKPWEGPLLSDAPMPEVEAPDDLDAHQEGRGKAPKPPFLDRMVMQHRLGEAPYTQAAEGLVGGWLGLREERPIDALTVAILADAWSPAPWPRLSAFAPAPTIELTIHFRSPLPVTTSATSSASPAGVHGRMLLGRFENELVRDGFFDESGKLWSADGTLIAQSRQLGLLLDAEA
jgi:hypothetical protein